jgi:hypothetical protein
VVDYNYLAPLRQPTPPAEQNLTLLDAALPLGTEWDVLPGSSVDSPDGSGPALKTSRWVGGYRYLPENQFAAELRAPNDTAVDAPALGTPPAATAVPAITGGTLTAAASPYAYQITWVNANGETIHSASVAATIASGIAGKVTLTFTKPADKQVAAGVTVNVYGRLAGSLGLIATGVTGTTFVDDGSATPGAAPPAADTTGGPSTYANLPWVTAIPFLVMVGETISTMGSDGWDFKGRLTRHLENATPAAVGREFWRGDYARAHSYPTNYLTKNGAATDLTPGGGPPSATRGLEILEDALASTGFGGQGMIHAQPQTLPSLLRSVLKDDEKLVTVLGNHLIPDAGYDGTGPGATPASPAAGSAWMFATDMVKAEVDDNIVFTPGSLEEAIDRNLNRVTIRAQRFATASFDGFRQFACRVLLDT